MVEIPLSKKSVVLRYLFLGGQGEKLCFLLGAVIPTFHMGLLLSFRWMTSQSTAFLFLASGFNAASMVWGDRCFSSATEDKLETGFFILGLDSLELVRVRNRRTEGFLLLCMSWMVWMLDVFALVPFQGFVRYHVPEIW